MGMLSRQADRPKRSRCTDLGGSRETEPDRTRSVSKAQRREEPDGRLGYHRQ